MACMESASLSAGCPRKCSAKERPVPTLEAVSKDDHSSIGNLETVFSRFLRRKRCRYTPQRKAIVTAFWGAEGHLTIEDLFVRVRSTTPSVGQSTVYRTMRLLCEAGLAREVSFGRGVIRYERVLAWNHEHFICERCGRSIEFVEPEIDTMGKRVARRYGFVLRQHRLYLYGLCAECLAAEARTASGA